ncbi:MAG: hypothetical protein KatS3mg013_1786 [Actinomycetota bacterium]|nr:MAG: hypothetical protein KatS3mg013_1786 [Actinomycetota bacterium]
MSPKPAGAAAEIAKAHQQERHADDEGARGRGRGRARERRADPRREDRRPRPEAEQHPTGEQPSQAQRRGERPEGQSRPAGAGAELVLEVQPGPGVHRALDEEGEQHDDPGDPQARVAAERRQRDPGGLLCLGAGLGAAPARVPGGGRDQGQGREEEPRLEAQPERGDDGAGEGARDPRRPRSSRAATGAPVDRSPTRGAARRRSRRRRSARCPLRRRRRRATGRPPGPSPSRPSPPRGSRGRPGPPRRAAGAPGAAWRSPS